MRVLLLLPQQEGEGESRSVVEALLGGRLLLLLWLWGVKKYEAVSGAGETGEACSVPEICREW